nr:TonB-dependent receptor [uncultured Sphingomonas sp.]
MPPTDQPAIIVTASLVPEQQGAVPASVSVIDGKRLERLGSPLLIDDLRLLPSVSVAETGPDGTLTQVRVRGAEANHTLLFIDGIRANDPAAGNEARFEFLSADLADRLELVRGPQSALWGSEAIGGVVAATSAQPSPNGSLFAEGGSHGSWRTSARGGLGDKDTGLTVALGGQGSNGIDGFDGKGDKDGYRNINARLAGRALINDHLTIGGTAFAIRGLSQFDGLDPLTYMRADTGDESRYRLSAARVFGQLGQRDTSFATLSASLLGSSNRNSLDGNPINRTWAKRRTLTLQAGTRLAPDHQLIAMAEAEREKFHARDTIYGGGADQDRGRSHQSLTVEYRGEFADRIKVDVAARHDAFSRFKNATTIRAGALVELGHGIELAGNYGQGIAQPTFFDLYGFFPGSFVGNPDLRPESSRGGEFSLRYSGNRIGAALTYYRQRLRHEIVGTYDPNTYTSSTVNADGVSKRQGVEAEGAYRPNDSIRLTATYSYLDASEPKGAVGMQIKEQRRPKHSGSVAVDGQGGRLSYGASMAYVGSRIDTDFDLYPSPRVRLKAYWLADGKIAYRVTSAAELSLRVANAFGTRYQDVVGYRTEGRSIHAGLRVNFGD